MSLQAYFINLVVLQTPFCRAERCIIDTAALLYKDCWLVARGQDAQRKAVNDDRGLLCCGGRSAGRSGLESAEELYRRRVTRILVDEFPTYFAVVTTIHRDSEVLGEVGGVINSTLEPRVEAVVPRRAFTKNVRLSLQVNWKTAWDPVPAYCAAVRLSFDLLTGHGE